MNLLWIILIVWGATFPLYALRVCHKFFSFFEGSVRNGTIVTSAIVAGLIWPVTLVLDGFRGVWTELGPVKIATVPKVNEGFVPEFDPTQPISLRDLVTSNAEENLHGK